MSSWRSDNPSSESWPAQQLAEFLATVSAHPSPAQATRRGIERVAEVLDAEVAAVVRTGCEPVSIGFPAGRVPSGRLIALAESDEHEAELPLLGRLAVASEPLDFDRLEWLVVARTTRQLSGEERDLLRGMARVLGLSREMLERRRLLERVSSIQRQIVRRASATEVMQAIVVGAAELTGNEIGVMRKLDRDDTTRTHVAACVGVDWELARSASGQGEVAIATQAILEHRMLVCENYRGSEIASPVMKGEGVETAMAAPVHEFGEVVGSLLVASRRAGRTYSAAERAALQTFAEHASMALTDAHMVDDALHRAMHDELTDLPNRALFTDRLDQALSRAERSGAQVTVLFLDIDRFKTVNDSLGHAAGDELLIAAARRLEHCIRPGDTVARFGGDEFAVLVEDAGAATGRRLGDRILKVFEKPFTVGGRPLHLSASIGIAIARRPEDDPLRDGDLAMYAAKAAGRGRHSLFAPAMREAAQERLELESELRAAEDRGELVLEYQPIVELSGGRMTTVEALLRWRHPRFGFIYPDAFLPLAEETHEINALGGWVLRSACAQARAWQQLEGFRPPRVAINISPTQLHGSDLVGAVREALNTTGLAPESLILELTETVIMEDVPSAIERLRSLKDLGVGLALDDFGTGYCSLQYLRRFPIDYLKIAQPFIADLAGPAADTSLIRAISDLGVSFGLTVIAEGIEQPKQRELLIDIGCELGQGFLFARPQAPELLLPPQPGVAVTD